VLAHLQVRLATLSIYGRKLSGSHLTGLTTTLFQFLYSFHQTLQTKGWFRLKIGQHCQLQTLANSLLSRKSTCSHPELLSCFQSNSGTINYKLLLAALTAHRPKPPNPLDNSLRIELGSKERGGGEAQTRQFLAFSAPLRWTVSAPAFRHNCLDSKQKKVGFFKTIT